MFRKRRYGHILVSPIVRQHHCVMYTISRMPIRHVNGHLNLLQLGNKATARPQCSKPFAHFHKEGTISRESLSTHTHGGPQSQFPVVATLLTQIGYPSAETLDSREKSDSCNPVLLIPFASKSLCIGTTCIPKFIVVIAYDDGANFPPRSPYCASAVRTDSMLRESCHS